jgi:hypothetical protein
MRKEEKFYFDLLNKKRKESEKNPREKSLL